MMHLGTFAKSILICLLGNTSIQGQTLGSINDSLHHLLPSIGERLTEPLQWKDLVIAEDSNLCIANPREWYYDRWVIDSKVNGRVGEVEIWHMCCDNFIRSIRIDTIVTVYSSQTGRFFVAAVNRNYSPCVKINDMTSTNLRPWQLLAVYDLRDPFNGQTIKAHDLTSGEGYLTFVSIMSRFPTMTRLIYRNGLRNGFTYTLPVDSNLGIINDLWIVENYKHGWPYGLYLKKSYEETSLIGFLDSIPGPDTLYLERRREFIVDCKGNVTEFREYMPRVNKPDFAKIRRRDGYPRINLASPRDIIVELFSSEDKEDYSHTWDFDLELLGCSWIMR